MKRNFLPYIFILPALVLFLMFFIFPNAYVFYLSMHELGPSGEAQENCLTSIYPRYLNENNFYRAEFDIKSGIFCLMRIYEGNEETLISDGFSSGRVGTWYKLRVEVIKKDNVDTIRSWIIGIENGYKIFENSCAPLNHGGLALSAYFNRDFTVVWDDLRMMEYLEDKPNVAFGEETSSDIENWERSRTIEIEGTGKALENYPIQFDIEWQTDMRADFGDIRFTGENGAEFLDYWIERYSRGQLATVWVKIPLLPENGTAIKVHYGNPEATSSSEIRKTFVFGDDFEDAAWTNAHFEMSECEGCSQVAENGEYVMMGNAGSLVFTNINLPEIPENIVLEVNVKLKKVGTREFGLSFVGAKNFLELFSDNMFLMSLLLVAGIAIQSIVVQVPAGLGLALALRNIRGSRTFLTIFFLPMTISLVTLCLMWKYLIFSPQGILNSTFGMSLDPTKDAFTLFLAVNIIADWIYIGLYTVMFNSAMKSIPKSVFDAAKVDGLSGFKTLRKIVIPALKNIILVSIIMCISGTFKTFDTWWVLGGGPTAPLHLPSTYLVTKIGSGLIGYASAIAVISFFICLVIVLIQLKAMKVKV
ncbi:MAG: DUF2341 domain-containing protein [Candidatus Hadarchaeales archaeon]